MNFEILKNKVALTFFAIGAVSLSVGGYDAWNAQNKQIKTTQKSPDIKQYQNISKDIKNNQATSLPDSISKVSTFKTIKIDVSGAVNFPAVYDLSISSRISDALNSAGGIDSKRADLAWVGRNINLATQLSDGDKIYIPTKNDLLPKIMPTTSPAVLGVGVTQGVLGYQQVIQSSQPVTQNSNNSTSTISTQPNSKISINNSSEKELDTLPGIGEVTAQKIIQSRPYTSIEELKSKKVVKPSVYEKIKDLIAL